LQNRLRAAERAASWAGVIEREIAAAWRGSRLCTSSERWVRGSRLCTSDKREESVKVMARRFRDSWRTLPSWPAARKHNEGELE
jgi:hypothetical protein